MYRAGSTFFGELFNQNPEIFYHFEPLTLFGYDKPNMEHKLRMLKEILVDCRSPKYSEYSEFVSFPNKIMHADLYEAFELRSVERFGSFSYLRISSSS